MIIKEEAMKIWKEKRGELIFQLYKEKRVYVITRNEARKIVSKMIGCNVELIPADIFSSETIYDPTLHV